MRTLPTRASRALAPICRRRCDFSRARPAGEKPRRLTAWLRAQNPAPFVILSRKLHIAVSYSANELDTTCASVADRLRKQAKTRAVKVLREAIADPMCGATARILRGFAGAHAPSLCLDKYILSRSNYIGSDRSRSYVVFPAKNRCGAEGGKAASSAAGALHAASEPRPAVGDQQLSAFFPVSLFITAIGDGPLARDISSKLNVSCVGVRRRQGSA